MIIWTHNDPVVTVRHTALIVAIFVGVLRWLGTI